MKMKSLLALGVLAGAAFGAQAEPMVKDGDKLAIIGDSITDQKMYTNYMATYIFACSGLKNASVMQFGWSGERAPGYVNRMANAYTFYPATVATTLYGMNDGGYRAFDANIGKTYQDNSEKIAKFMNEKGVKFLAGSPGAVDFEGYKRPNCTPQVYNDTLAKLGELGEKVAVANKAKFFNMNKLLIDTMTAAQKAKGKNYFVCGSDGVHPGPNGQLVMAYGFLKALGFEGAIGAINMDFAEGKATATEGHKVLSAKAGSVEMASSRYPFVFSVGDTPNQTASILPFLPFNKDLNRFILTVQNLPADKATVQFGNGKKSFTKAQLEQGINLADEFIAETPFRSAFDKVSQAVRQQQEFETWVHKVYLMGDIPSKLPAAKSDAKVIEAVNALNAVVRAEREKLEAASHAAVVPVKYTINVTPEK